VPEPEHKFNERILWDWFYQCRTCQFWGGDRKEGLSEGPCNKEDSPHFEVVLGCEGTCDKWDPYDVDLACRVMEDSEILAQASMRTSPRTPEQEAEYQAARRRWEDV